MKHGHFKVSAVSVLDTYRTKTLAKHVLDTSMPYGILNNHKITCRHRVQCRIDIK